MLDGYSGQIHLHTVITVMVLVNDVLNMLPKIGLTKFSVLRCVKINIYAPLMFLYFSYWSSVSQFTHHVTTSNV